MKIIRVLAIFVPLLFRETKPNEQKTKEKLNTIAWVKQTLGFKKAQQNSTINTELNKKNISNKTPQEHPAEIFIQLFMMHDPH